MTAAKLTILGGKAEYEGVFRERGLALTRPVTGSKLSWSAEVDRLRALGPPAQAYLPDEDRAALKRLGYTPPATAAS